MVYGEVVILPSGLLGPPLIFFFPAPSVFLRLSWQIPPASLSTMVEVVLPSGWLDPPLLNSIQ